MPNRIKSHPSAESLLLAIIASILAILIINGVFLLYQMLNNHDKCGQYDAVLFCKSPVSDKKWTSF